jgi:hypothetical protein
MRQISVFAATALFGAVLLFSGVASSQETKPSQGRGPIKTSVLTDAPRRPVLLSALLALGEVPGVAKDDPRFQAARITNFDNPAHLEEGDMVTTTGWLHVVAAAKNGDYEIQISAGKTDGDHGIIMVVPRNDPAYVASATLREKAGDVRAWIKAKLLRGKEPSERGSVMTHAPYVEVTGQLFYDDAYVGEPPRGKKGMKAATLWELNPVTAIRFAPAP